MSKIAPSTETVPPKMDPKLKAKWLRALRSGEIKQGRGALLDDEGRMCCVGVLGRVCGIPDTTLLEYRQQLAGEGLKPVEVLGEVAWKLGDMNDGKNFRYKRPRSFKQIADWIEKNL